MTQERDVDGHRVVYDGDEDPAEIFGVTAAGPDFEFRIHYGHAETRRFVFFGKRRYIASISIPALDLVETLDTRFETIDEAEHAAAHFAYRTAEALDEPRARAAVAAEISRRIDRGQISIHER